MDTQATHDTHASESGQVIIIALIFMVIILLITGALLGLVGQNVGATRNALAAEQAVQLAEAGIDRAVWQLNETAGGYTGETGTVLGAGVFDVEVQNISASEKELVATGFVPDAANPRASKTLKVRVSIDTTTVNFNYGVQVGEGGLTMDNNAIITGNVYSNGTIQGSNGARISGDAFSAGSTGRIYNALQIDGNAYAHTLNQNITVGGSAFGYTMDQVTVGGNVFTNSLSRCTVGGDASYTSVSSCTIAGTQNPGYPGESDPEQEEFPISDEQIDDWKQVAASGGTISGNYTLDNFEEATMGPKKIDGDLTLSNGAELTLTGPIWVTGDIAVSNNAIIALDSAYGNNSEVVIADQPIDVSNNAIFQKAGPDSYVLMITTSTSSDAFDVANNADALIVYAPHGGVDISNNAVIREVTAWQLHISNNAEVIYETGLANVNFSGGPGASWQIVRGTYREVAN